ncbi:MAG: efflux RND transporter periplasmic adaptor subunit [Treponema sp.]|jgi:multidrug efflux pump subunit AcrA (membrane-fusion protein)|nr:efflux RND transporter periplasmic adaptor subunit [Treponema sp.]
MRHSRGSRTIVFVFFLMVVIIAVISLLNRCQGAPEAGGTRAGSAPTIRSMAVRAQPVGLGTVEETLALEGEVQIRTQVAIYPALGGRLSESRFRVGDRVEEGQTIAWVAPASRPGDFFSPSPVVAPVSGTVLRVPAAQGDTVTVQTPILVLGNLSDLVIAVPVPEQFSAALRRGQTAWVQFTALPGETFGAVVDELSLVLDGENHSLPVRLRFSGGADPRIKAGMSAALSLVTATRTGVPVIPRSSVLYDESSPAVFVVREEGLAEGRLAEGLAERRNIVLGLAGDTTVEVLEGLDPGELLVTAGQHFLAPGVPVRVVE